tara:strand:+ start:1495 stop:1893 length:399 start_codon:yes stop_codon:yes gene_type:complete
MKIKQTVKVLLAAGLLMTGLVFVAAQPSYAQESCGGVDTAIISCSEDGTGDDVENTGLWAVLKIAIGIMTGLVGVAALGGLVYGAVLYTSAGPNMEQVKKARGIFTNVVIGVVAYGLMVVGLNFLIPGGVFG